MFLITLGEPQSINIECLQKILLSEPEIAFFTLLIGSNRIFEQQASEALRKKVTEITFDQISYKLSCPGLYFLDCQTFEPEKISAEALFMSKKILEKFPNQRAAILTAPVDKMNLHKADFKFPGQTEFFENIVKVPTLMCLAGAKLRVGLVTNHLALKDVSANLSEELVYQKLQTLNKGLKENFKIKNPRIFVAALNPHASDNGLFGDEEQKILIPAIQRAQRAHIQADGPLPADTVFYRAFIGEADAVLAMYHDQGLGPLKLVHFDTAINITMGLPFLRISPDHGPAKDIAGQNKANIKSFEQCFKTVQNYLNSK